LLGWDQAGLGITSLYCLTILFNLTSLTIGIPRIFNRFAAIAKIQIVFAMVKLGAIVWVSFLPNASINSYIIVYLLADAGANIAMIFFGISVLRHNYGPKWWREPATIDKEQLRFIWWTNLRTVLRIPVRHFDMIIIGSVMSLELVGTYRVYKEIAGIITRIGDPVNQAIFPEYSRMINRGNSSEAMQAGKKTIMLMAFFSVVIVLPILLTSHLIVKYFFGPTYTQCIPALQALIVFYGISFILIPVNSLFIAAGFARSSFWVVVLTNSIYLITAYCLGKVIGVYGIVVAYATQSFLNTGIKMLILAKRGQKFR
jgi:O-antigen/teichoic acid export membrane protein